ncbi:MAG: adenylosuccinate synthetase, partial [Chitinophagales bacterium]|nr:adenylosuccinate synthetase [Chitinophagales bacterium]
EIKVCDSYNVNGKETKELPFEVTDSINCNFKSFKGWESDLEGIAYHSLPSNLEDFVSYMENYLAVPVSMISTGPEREKLLINQSALV